MREAPDGYSDYQEYTVPEKWIGGAYLLLLAGLGELLFPGSIGWLYQRVNGDLVDALFLLLDEILFIVVLIGIHEGIHYAVAVAQGYSPNSGVRFVESFVGIKEPVPYVVVLREHISRDENIAMLVAPLLVIDAVALLGLLPVFPDSVAHYAMLALVLTSSHG